MFRSYPSTYRPSSSKGRRIALVIVLVLYALAWADQASAASWPYLPLPDGERYVAKVRTWCPAQPYHDPLTEELIYRRSDDAAISGRPAAPGRWLDNRVGGGPDGPAWLYERGRLRVWLIAPDPNTRVAINRGPIPALVFSACAFYR